MATKQPLNTPTTSSGRRLASDRQSPQEQQSSSDGKLKSSAKQKKPICTPTTSSPRQPTSALQSSLSSRRFAKHSNLDSPLASKPSPTSSATPSSGATNRSHPTTYNTSSQLASTLANPKHPVGKANSLTTALSASKPMTGTTNIDQLRIDNHELLTHSSVMSKRLANLRSRSLPDSANQPHSEHMSDDNGPLTTPGHHYSRTRNISESDLDYSSDENNSSHLQLETAPLSEEQARQLYLKHPYLIESSTNATSAASARHKSNHLASSNEYNRRLLFKEPFEQHEHKKRRTQRRLAESAVDGEKNSSNETEIPQEVAQLLQRSARARMDLSNTQHPGINKRNVSNAGISGAGVFQPSNIQGSSAYARFANSHRSDSMKTDLTATRVPPYRRSFTPGAVLGNERSVTWTPVQLTRSSTLDRISIGSSIGGMSSGCGYLGSVGSATGSRSAAGGGSLIGNASGLIGDSSMTSGLNSLTNLTSLGSHKPRSDYANRKFALLKSRSSHTLGNGE